MMLLEILLQRKGAKRRKIILETTDIKDGLIRTVKLLKKELLVSTKSLPRFPKDPIVRLVKNKEHSFRKKMLDNISLCERNDPKLFRTW